jgi:hypothetical protein
MDPTDEITLRTRPLHVPEFVLGPDGTRKFPTAAAVSVLVPPGIYAVKLVAGDVERTAPLTVRKDPNTAGTEEDVAAQTKAMLSIRDNANVVAKMINTAESIRAQLVSWRTLARTGPVMDEVNAAADDLEKQIVDVESRLFNLTATGRGQDFLRTPSQMVQRAMRMRAQC